MDHVNRDGSHHGAPLFNPQKRVWLEIHTALFSKGASVLGDHLFGRSHVEAQTATSGFRGRVIHRLSDELQLAYIAGYWLRDLAINGIHPSFIIPLLDAIYLLGAAGEDLDWDELFSWLDNKMAAASLYVLLAYLSRHEFYQTPRPVLSRLARCQHVVGAMELRIIHAILSSYLIDGIPFTPWLSDWTASIALNTLLAPGSHAARLTSLPWNLAFPPSMPGRYGIRYQLQRITKRLRGNA